MTLKLLKRFYRGALNNFRQKFPQIYRPLDKYKIYIKYLIAGSTAAAADLSLLYILTDLFGFWYLLSSSIAFTISLFISFSLQKFWTFGDADRSAIKKQFIFYLGVALVNLTINAVGMYILVEKTGIWYLLAQIIMGASIATENFLIYRFIIFKTSRAV